MTVGVTRQAVSVLEGELLQFCLKILEGVVQQEALVIAVSTFNGTAFGKNFKCLLYSFLMWGHYVVKLCNLFTTHLCNLTVYQSVVAIINCNRFPFHTVTHLLYG